MNQGYQPPLIASFSRAAQTFPQRIWLLDNSSSMNVKDSHRIYGNYDNIQKQDNVSRWEELWNCVAHHAQMCCMYQMSTKFVLLNKPSNAPQAYDIASMSPTNDDLLKQEILRLKHVMTSTTPSGPTMLTKELINVRTYVSSRQQQLLQNNQTITLVIATQGLPTDANGISSRNIVNEFILTLQSLQSLPVWIVIRLCTDDESIFDFYNNLDVSVGKYDVLDDIFGEALEIYLRNPWLTYGLSLHRYREMGFILYNIIDSIDERSLSIMEVSKLCSILFGVVLPNPTSDWNGFINSLQHVIQKEKLQYNPVTRKLSPWINIHDLIRLYGGQAQRQQPHQNHYPWQPHFPRQQQQQQQQQNPRYEKSPRQQFPYSRENGNKQIPPTPPQQQQQQQQQAQHMPDSRAQPQHLPSAMPVNSNNGAPSSNSDSGVFVHNVVVVKDGSLSELKRNIMLLWALTPPNYTSLRPIHYLLSNVQQTFPPNFGMKDEEHDYFKKFEPFSPDALSTNQENVIKRAVRKMKFFLHPDKLPKDFKEKQLFLCKTLWDVTNDAWEEYKENQG